MAGNIRHILILTETPFRQRDHERFGIDVLSRHFQVRILDCTPLLRPELWASFGGKRYASANYVPVSTVEEMEEIVAPLSSQTVAIDYLLPSGSVHTAIRRILRKHAILRSRVFAGVMPLPMTYQWRQRAREVIKRGRDIISGGYRKLRCALHPMLGLTWSMADITVLSGVFTLRNPEAQTPYRIWAHSFDYDIFLALRECLPEPVPPYAVFLDQNLVERHDFLITRTPAYVTAEKYFPPLNRFFEQFEERAGLPVVIAAHPKTPYTNDISPFMGRKLVVGETARLIQGASLVFAHYSTALSFPVLWGKPVVFLTTDELQASRYQDYVEAFQASLASPLLNVDHYHSSDIDLKRWMQVSSHHYTAYKEQYIKTPGSLDLPLWEIFSDALKRGIDRGTDEIARCPNA